MGEPLRIAQVAPIARPVTPYSGGSIEQIVSLLTEELVARGHDVTLFATGYSDTSAKLEAIYPRGYDDDEDLWEWEFHELLHMAAAVERAQEFDLLHSHVYHFGLPFTRLVQTPIVHTYHVLPDDDIVRAYSRYPEARLVAISAYQRRKLDGLPDLPVIHHGIDVARFPFSDSSGDYLLFLGRVTGDKGAVEAMHVAEKAGMPLLMAGPAGEDFRYVVEPLLGHHPVEYVGPVDIPTRNELLAGAGALLYPIKASETFGLVMVEAMACGTPVLAFDRGAVPEIVEPGVTGYVARDADSLVELVPSALTLDRARIREATQARFDHGRMVDEYLALYQQVVSRSRGLVAE
jgi:glycosyltransferase involved in cell wall biosynthesis